MSFTYVASPYSSKDPEIIQRRFNIVEEFTGLRLLQGEHLYSPIVHCHEIAKKYDLPKDFKFWQDYNRAMLSTASLMIVLMIDGWKESVGVQGEIEFAEQCGIQVIYESV